MGWFRRHARELIRGSILGLVAGIVVCVLAWEPCPAPLKGDTEAMVIERWGPPDSVSERRRNDLPANMLSLKRLTYRCGLFNTGITIVYVDSEGKVIDTVQGVP